MLTITILKEVSVRNQPGINCTSYAKQAKSTALNLFGLSQSRGVWADMFTLREKRQLRAYLSNFRRSSGFIQLHLRQQEFPSFQYRRDDLISRAVVRQSLLPFVHFCGQSVRLSYILSSWLSVSPFVSNIGTSPLPPSPPLSVLPSKRPLVWIGPHSRLVISKSLLYLASLRSTIPSPVIPSSLLSPSRTLSMIISGFS